MIDLTVGLFTFHRTRYLERQLKFFYKLGYDFRLVVLDGSEEEDVIESNKTLCKKYKVEYYHEFKMQERHVILNSIIDTNYVAYAADDDLMVPNFYTTATNYLRDNKQYSVITAKLKTLHYLNNYARLGFYLGGHLGGRYDIYMGDFVEKIIRRDQAYGMGVPPTFYGVRKSEVHELFSKYVTKLDLLSSCERLEALSNFVFGGIKTIDAFMGFRDYSSDPTRQAYRDDPKQYISDPDIKILKEFVVENHSEDVSNELLNYYQGYAWPLPVRNQQSESELTQNKYKIVVKCICNKIFPRVLNQDIQQHVLHNLKCVQKVIY